MLEAKAFYGTPPPAEPVVSVINEKSFATLMFQGFGGQGGIRTHESLARLPDFESGPL